MLSGMSIALRRSLQWSWVCMYILWAFDVVQHAEQVRDEVKTTWLCIYMHACMRTKIRAAAAYIKL